MRRFLLGWLGVFSLLAVNSVLAAETLTVGGAVVTIPDGWSRADAEGRVVLVPRDLPAGVVCSLTLLGGESFTGSVMDRLANDWKELSSSGKIVRDDKGRMDGAGQPVEVASRAGSIEVKPGVQVYIWMVILHTNGRIERMIVASSTPEAFAKYLPAVGTMIDGAKFFPVADPAAPKAAPVAPKPAPNTPRVDTAPAGTFGHMRYTVPRGWTEKRYANGIILSLDNPTANEQLELQLMAPRPAAGTLADGMATAWDDACTQLGASKTNTVNNTAYTAEAPRKSFKGWDYIRATGIVTSKADHGDYCLDLFVIKINGRFERLTVVSPIHTHNLSRYSLYDSPVHRRTIQEFVFGMAFDDWKDAVVAPASLKGDGIVGVWQGISMFGGTFKAAYAIFYSNGQVFFGSRFPLSGCDGQKTWIEAELTPRYWGTYSFQNDGGVIKMIYGEVPIRSKGNDLVLTTNKTDHTFVRVPSVDGARFNDTYIMAEAYEKIPVITFTADGHFKDEGAIRALDHDHTNPFSITIAPGAGSYSVRDHTITFRYDDGRVYLLAYPGADYDKSNPSPGQLTLGFNEDPLKKK